MRNIVVVAVLALFCGAGAMGETPAACSEERQTVSGQEGTQLLTNAYRMLGPDRLDDASVSGMVDLDGAPRAFRLFWSKGLFRYEVDTAAATRTLLFKQGELVELRDGAIYSRSWNFDEELLAPIFPLLWLRQRLNSHGVSRVAATDKQEPDVSCLNETEVKELGDRKVVLGHTWTVDLRSGLVRAVRYSLPRREDAAARVVQRVEYSNYSNIAGYQIPMLVTVHAEGSRPAHFTITGVKLDTGIPDSRFEISGGAQ